MVRFANSEGFLDCEFAPNIVDLIANLEQMGYIISHDYGLADTYLVRVLSRNGVACISEKHDEMNWFVADETEEDSEQELN